MPHGNAEDVVREWDERAARERQLRALLPYRNAPRDIQRRAEELVKLGCLAHSAIQQAKNEAMVAEGPRSKRDRKIIQGRPQLGYEPPRTVDEVVEDWINQQVEAKVRRRDEGWRGWLHGDGPYYGIRTVAACTTTLLQITILLVVAL